MKSPFSLASKVVATVLNYNAVTYDGGSGAAAIVAIFEEETEIIGGDGEIITTAPALFVHKDEFGEIVPEEGHKVTVDGVAWVVDAVYPDSHEGFAIPLKRDRTL